MSLDFVEYKSTMEILTIGWAAILAVFTYSIAMVVWGRHGM